MQSVAPLGQPSATKPRFGARAAIAEAIAEANNRSVVRRIILVHTPGEKEPTDVNRKEAGGSKPLKF